MGFFTRGNFLKLPTKTIVEDLLERDGPPTENSYTPYEGANKLLAEQLKGERYKYIDIKTVIEDVISLGDFNIKIHQDAEYRKKVNSTDEEFYFEYTSYLEDIPQSEVHAYISKRIVNAKTFRTCSTRQEANKMFNVALEVQDLETGDNVNISDIWVDRSEHMDLDMDVVYESKMKLPYYLKKLYDGSMLYGFSLMSVLITRERFVRFNKGKTYDDLMPNNILLGLYRMRNGIPAKCYDDSDSIKSNLNFLRVLDIARGRVVRKDGRIIEDFRNNIFHIAMNEVVKLSENLGVDIIDEDPGRYDGTFISNLKSNYVMSNQEILYDMVNMKDLELDSDIQDSSSVINYDSRIIDIFKNGNLFKVQSFRNPIDDYSDTSYQTSGRFYQSVIAKASLADVFHRRIDEINHSNYNFDTPDYRIDRVQEFIPMYMATDGYFKCKQVSPNFSKFSELIVKDEVYHDVGISPAIFDLTFVNIGFDSFNINDTLGGKFAILTNRGYLISITDNMDEIKYCTVTSLLHHLLGGIYPDVKVMYI